VGGGARRPVLRWRFSRVEGHPARPRRRRGPHPRGDLGGPHLGRRRGVAGSELRAVAYPTGSPPERFARVVQSPGGPPPN